LWNLGKIPDPICGGICKSCSVLFWRFSFAGIVVFCQIANFLLFLVPPLSSKASCGVALGVGLSVWEPEDDNAKSITLQWVGLVGDMFIRSLKAIVLPLVFVNVLISVVDMMSLGRASSVGWKTIGLYTLTTLIASVIGLIAIGT